uniref:Uncharacterized protein n=1 Tax=Oryza punctata TaxID=4537 RepID=A0A0E0JQN2_ORYPU
MAYLASVLGALARAECQFGQPSPAAFSSQRAAAFSPLRRHRRYLVDPLSTTRFQSVTVVLTMGESTELEKKDLAWWKQQGALVGHGSHVTTGS